MIWVIGVILLMLLALFVLLRYERYAHRDKETGALDESLFTGIKLGLADDWRRIKGHLR